MSARSFLDTNILVYSFDLFAPEKARIAKEILRKAKESRSAVISYQVVQEFFGVALTKFISVFPSAQADRYLTTVLVPLLEVYPSPALYSRALQIKDSFQLHWYDSLIVAAALQSNCSTLLTEDMQHGMRIDNLRIENPFLPH